MIPAIVSRAKPKNHAMNRYFTHFDIFLLFKPEMTEYKKKAIPNSAIITNHNKTIDTASGISKNWLSKMLMRA